MSIDERLNLQVRRSFNAEVSPRLTEQEIYWKSDVNLTDPLVIEYSHIENVNIYQDFTRKDHDKKYELDEIPVKESSSSRLSSAVEQAMTLTNSHLNRLEIDVFENISQELKKPSLVSLESSVKLFKITVQEIFDNFFKNMKDFEDYKNKFHDIILNSRKRDTIEEMEYFIKDMIQCITTASDTSLNERPRVDDVAYEGSKSVVTMDEILNNVEKKHTSEYVLNKLNSIVDACKVAKNSAVSINEGMIHEDKTKEMINFHLVTDKPVIDNNMKCHDQLSEINLNINKKYDTIERITSSDNITDHGAKKVQKSEHSIKDIAAESDREIPIRETSAKKNIHLNEDFKCDTTNRSLVSKICSYLCRKVRRNSSV